MTYLQPILIWSRLRICVFLFLANLLICWQSTMAGNSISSISYRRIPFAIQSSFILIYGHLSNGWVSFFGCFFLLSFSFLSRVVIFDVVCTCGTLLLFSIAFVVLAIREGNFLLFLCICQKKNPLRKLLEGVLTTCSVGSYSPHTLSCLACNIWKLEYALGDIPNNRKRGEWKKKHSEENKRIPCHW